MTIARDILDRRRAVVDQLDADDADRRLEAMAPGSMPAHMRKRHGEADRPVAAHAEIADIVEEDDAGRAGRVVRLAQQRADQRVVAARLVDGEAADMIELARRSGAPLGERPAPERRPAVDDHAASARPRCGSR